MADYIDGMIPWLAGMDPRALLLGLLALGTLLAFPPFIVSLDRLSRLRLASGTLYLLLGVLLVLLGLGSGIAAASLHTYRKLTQDQLVATVAIHRTGEREFKLSLTTPDAGPRDFPVVGDVWQIEARLVKWPRAGAASGFHTVYRLERLSSHEAEGTQTRGAARSVHGLALGEPVDVWVFLRRYRDYLGFIEASNASTGYMPMAEGAQYAVTISASGLAVRTAHAAARGALGTQR
jgi:hypothetical protein